MDDKIHTASKQETGKSARHRLAETTSSVGAGLLGLGLGVLFARFLSPAGLPLLVLGLVMHGYGMLDMRRLEATVGEERPLWSKVLYWVCWAALATLAIYLVADLADR